MAAVSLPVLGLLLAPAMAACTEPMAVILSARGAVSAGPGPLEAPSPAPHRQLLRSEPVPGEAPAHGGPELGGAAVPGAAGLLDRGRQPILVREESVGKSRRRRRGPPKPAQASKPKKQARRRRGPPKPAPASKPKGQARRRRSPPKPAQASKPKGQARRRRGPPKPAQASKPKKQARRRRGPPKPAPASKPKGQARRRRSPPKPAQASKPKGQARRRRGPPKPAQAGAQAQRGSGTQTLGQLDRDMIMGEVWTDREQVDILALINGTSKLGTDLQELEHIEERKIKDYKSFEVAVGAKSKQAALAAGAKAPWRAITATTYEAAEKVDRDVKLEQVRELQVYHDVGVMNDMAKGYKEDAMAALKATTKVGQQLSA